ncbi:MAG: glycosyl hydrolase family 65 protein [Nocardioidaceae bacterium]
MWGALVFGFGGFRDLGAGQWCFDPRLPDAWDGLVYRLHTLLATRLRIELQRDQATFQVEDGQGRSRSTSAVKVMRHARRPRHREAARQGPRIAK